MTEAELAYMAGFFDGEGSINLLINNPTLKNGGNLFLRCQVGQIRVAPLMRFFDAFGGFLSPANTTGKIWHYQANGRKAETLLSSLYPYLVLKQVPAAYALGAYVNPAESVEGKREQIMELRELNKANRTFDFNVKESR